MLKFLSRQKGDAEIRIVGEDKEGKRAPTDGVLFIQGEHSNYHDVDDGYKKKSGFKVHASLNIKDGYIGSKVKR